MAEANTRDAERSNGNEERAAQPVNMMDIPWFHPDLTRHQAEAELANCDEGIYLLRPSNHGQVSDSFSLDLKCSHTVKHFKVKVSSEGIEFGQEVFLSLDSFLCHFDNCPLIGDDTGKLNILKYPYPRDVDEIHDYQLITEHFLPNNRPHSQSPDAQVHSLVSKEGYLIKMGAVVKSWRERWFVLKSNQLRYYKKENDSQPIRTINLEACSEVEPCQIQNRNHVFKPSAQLLILFPGAEGLGMRLNSLHLLLRQPELCRTIVDLLEPQATEERLMINTEE